MGRQNPEYPSPDVAFLGLASTRELIAELSARVAVGSIPGDYRTVDAGRYRLWVNDERTVLFRVFDSGTAEIATRGDAGETWGPPLRMLEERTS